MVEARLAGQHAGGVAPVHVNTSPDEVLRFNAPGFYGARFSFMIHLSFPDLSTVCTSMALVRPIDWHIAIHVAGSGLVVMEELIRGIDAPVVIDHMGRPISRRGRTDRR